MATRQSILYARLARAVNRMPDDTLAQRKRRVLVHVQGQMWLERKYGPLLWDVFYARGIESVERSAGASTGGDSRSALGRAD